MSKGNWYSPEGFVAVEPFPSQAIEKVVVDGILQTRAKKGLTRLKVLAVPLEQLSVYGGNLSHVYLPSDYNVSNIHGKNVYQKDDTSFILVPTKDVKVFSREDD